MTDESCILAEGPYTTEFVLSAEERRAVFDLRMRVFVEEQGVPPEEELDALDLTATHFLARIVGTFGGAGIVGTARLIDTEAGIARVGRVAVLPTHRRRGVGALLMRSVETHARTRELTRLILDSQVAAIHFYEKLGYVAEGDVFLEANIEHRHMQKAL